MPATSKFVIRTAAGEKLTTIPFAEANKDKMFVEAQRFQERWIANARHLINTEVVIKEE